MRVIQKPESLKQQIYNILKEDIVNQRYQDEEVLNERTISEELKVSRTPVREALKALEMEGWVEYVPYKGAVVKSMSMKDLKNIFLIRSSLEALAVELAVENMTEELTTDLEQFLVQQRKLLGKTQKPIEDFIFLDQEFHKIIAKWSQNELLSEFLLKLTDKARAFGIHALLIGDQRFFETIAEHEKIIEAIIAKDAKLAKQYMETHIQQTYKNAYEYLKKK